MVCITNGLIILVRCELVVEPDLKTPYITIVKEMSILLEPAFFLKKHKET